MVANPEIGDWGQGLDGSPCRLVDPAAFSGPAQPPPASAATRADAIAYIQLTSGTSGLRRGVTLPHRAILALSRAIASRPEDISINWMPLYHDAGTAGSLWCPLQEPRAALLAQAVAVAADGDDVAVLQEPIEDGGGDS